MPVHSDGDKIVFGEEAQVLKGDLDANAVINISDVSLLLDLISGSGYDAVGDMNDSGTLDISDVTAILNILAA